jgi:hypothetical protein
MIPKANNEIRKAHATALEMDKTFISDDETNHAAIAYERLRKDLWIQVFQAAECCAQMLNNPEFNIEDHKWTASRSFDAADIVNHWYLDIESNTQIAHDFRAHDRTTGFKTISQELRELEENENRLAYQLWEREFRKWYDNGKIGTKPRLPRKVRYTVVREEDHDTYGHGAWSEVQDEVETLEMLRERRADIRQDSADDPENPYEDDRGRRRLAHNRSLFDRHDPKNPKLMYRGQKGLLGGVYQLTDPEPYNGRSSPQGRMQLMRALLRSDNVIDIMLAKGMNRKFKFPAEQRASRNLKQLQA